MYVGAALRPRTRSTSALRPVSMTMPTGLSARKRVATETVLAGQVRVEYDDVARLLLQPAIERRRIVTGERHPETIAAQAQRQLLPEVRIILKQADTQQTIRAGIFRVLYSNIVDKCPRDAASHPECPAGDNLTTLQWKRMIAVKKPPYFTS